jgi:hypothetical protein
MEAIRFEGGVEKLWGIWIHIRHYDLLGRLVINEGNLLKMLLTYHGLR